jgi:RNA polymerase sigma factor for flagellar operon FliA
MATVPTRGRRAASRRDDQAPTPEALELERLWREFKETESGPARERLILHYAPLVKYVAGRLGAGLPQSVEQADLVSNGMFGLMDALDKYDLAREVKFETYAIPRIRGAILDELRAMDWVPRSIRFKAREVEKATTQLEAKLGREPSDAEIAQQLGLDLEELHEIITQISLVSVMALEDVVTADGNGEPRSLLDTLADAASSEPTAGLEGQEMRSLLSAAISSLTEREKIVVTLYYFEGLTLSEIGDILGVTESRVCQIHTKAVGLLRDDLADRDDD